MAAAVLALGGCGSGSGGGGKAPAEVRTAAKPATPVTPVTLPKPDHVVVVLFENKEDKQVHGSSTAPYFNALAARGATFTNSTGVTHPSQPNYLALFSGSTQGVSGDDCLSAGKFAGPDLGGELIAAGKTFAGYSESMPSDGFTACTGKGPGGDYASKHNPWRDFSDVPAADNRTFAAFPQDFSQLPTVSFVVPNMCDDMHDCGVATGDAWLKAGLGAYADWAPAHNSLLVVTFDEDDFTEANVIPTIIVGAGVKPGPTAQHIDHYAMLRTLEDLYGLPHAGASAQAAPITGIWTTGS
ncbi:alkaline phosphatase family protein [Catenulispora subtropica]